MDEVIHRVGLSKSQIYRMMKSGEFPKSVPVTSQRVGFLKSEIEKWFAERLKMRDEGVGVEKRRQRAILAVRGRR